MHNFDIFGRFIKMNSFELIGFNMYFVELKFMFSLIELSPFSLFFAANIIPHLNYPYNFRIAFGKAY
jgi:hypothetical protein